MLKKLNLGSGADIRPGWVSGQMSNYLRPCKGALPPAERESSEACACSRGMHLSNSAAVSGHAPPRSYSALTTIARRRNSVSGFACDGRQLPLGAFGPVSRAFLFLRPSRRHRVHLDSASPSMDGFWRILTSWACVPCGIAISSFGLF